MGTWGAVTLACFCGDGPAANTSTSFWRETNGWKWSPFMVGYMWAAPHAGQMLTTLTHSRATAVRFKEVETVRLFTSAGHPWMGLAALVLLRLPLLAGATYLIIRGLPF